MISDDASHHILCMLGAPPQIIRRMPAHEAGGSLGQVSYCLRAMAAQGSLTSRSCIFHDDEKPYLYELTPLGLLSQAAFTEPSQVRKPKEDEVPAKAIGPWLHDAGSLEPEALRC